MSESFMDLEALLAESGRVGDPRRGDLLHGTVLSSDERGLIIDLGLKRDGVVPRSDLEELSTEEGHLGPGDEISVMVVEPLDGDGNLVVSVAQARESVILGEDPDPRAGATATSAASASNGSHRGR